MAEVMLVFQMVKILWLVMFVRVVRTNCVIFVTVTVTYPGSRRHASRVSRVSRLGMSRHTFEVKAVVQD